MTTPVPRTMTLLPPPPTHCQECATIHMPEQPHNKLSLFYQIKFQQLHDRAPTWADAMAHCTSEMKSQWRAMLQRSNLLESEETNL